MIRAVQHWAVRGLLVLALVAGALAPPAGWVAAQALPTPGPSSSAASGEPSTTALAPARAAAVASAALVLQEAWDLLLDRFMEPLDPALLAGAADSAMRDLLTGRGVAVDETPLAAGGERLAAWDALSQRFQALAARYSAVEPTALAHAAIAGMAAAADDSHTNFMTPRQYQEHLAWIRGEVKYGGIGARLRGPVLTIVEVFANSPAAAAGLQPGDRILAVDDTPTDDLRVDQVVQLVRGPAGTPVTLRVQRAGSDRVETLQLTRAEIQMPFVESQRFDDIGYVRLRGFPEPSIVDNVERAIADLQEQGVRGLILDLRGNSGGRLDVGTRLLSRFIPSGPIYQEVDRRGGQRIRQVRASTPILTVPLAVLVDEGTASMGEIFAVNIQEHGVGHLIGQTTMGSVAASQVLPLADGSALQLSIMQIYSGQGAPLNRVGVQPDEVVELRLEDLQSGRDPQLDRALAYLRGLPARPTAARASSAP
ncbi:MAG TPA: S41 family peptidase [Chloroflexota bacterium]|nr:S41 family peptidase [Chloroflexota bacterium]